MSYLDFKSAMELAPKCKFYTTVGGKTKEEIMKSEELLKVIFSKQCIEFYEKFGYLSLEKNIIYQLNGYLSITLKMETWHT